ncbi:cuticle protein 10.9-like [Uloborus diversus]|uniref:cuticle protein 10.9-like n=1 Tax=Uloborus diversus TaxID=327109 RepID=UPI0024094F0E|nr:cuticle protein 10.9-like [Uloborus diversus]
MKFRYSQQLLCSNTRLSVRVKMFKFVLIASLVAVAIAQRYGHHAPGPVYGGYSAPAPAYGHHEDYAQPIPYQYGFDIVGGDAHSGDFKQTRQEHSDGHGNVQGSYGYTDAHGVYRQVDYVADAHGYRAQIKTNEPGTEAQNPADVELHASAPHHAPQAYAPRPSYGHHAAPY